MGRIGVRIGVPKKRSCERDFRLSKLSLLKAEFLVDRSRPNDPTLSARKKKSKDTKETELQKSTNRREARIIE